MTQMPKHQLKGFTIIELTLAMTFLSILLLAIAVLVIQLSNVYTKGITLKAANEAGTRAASDIRRELNQAGELDEEDDIVVMKTGTVATAGRLCTGKASYAWNLGENVGKEGGTTEVINRFENDDREIRLLKVTDVDKTLCQRNDEDTYDDISTDVESSDLLQEGDRDLVVHHMDIVPVTTDEGQTIVRITMTLGTKGVGLVQDSTCRAPNNSDGEEFCSVNTFKFTARLGGGEVGE